MPAGPLLAPVLGVMRRIDAEDLDRTAPALTDWRDEDDSGFLAAARERLALLPFVAVAIGLAGLALVSVGAYLQGIAAALPLIESRRPRRLG